MFNRKKMKELRRRKGWSQQKMADLFEEKISKTMIGFYESGEEVPTEYRIQEIAKILGVEESILTEEVTESSSDIMEEFRATIDFMKEQYNILTQERSEEKKAADKEKAELRELLKLALSGNGPKLEDNGQEVPVIALGDRSVIQMAANF